MIRFYGYLWWTRFLDVVKPRRDYTGHRGAVEALREYGQHHDDCSLRDPFMAERQDVECDCGLDAALREGQP